MPGRIRVEVDALEGLADACDAIVGTMEDISTSAFDASPQVMGDASLAEGLRDYFDRWSVRRGELVEDLRAASSVLDAVATRLAEADAELAAQIPDARGTP